MVGIAWNIILVTYFSVTLCTEQHHEYKHGISNSNDLKSFPSTTTESSAPDFTDVSSVSVLFDSSSSSSSDLTASGPEGATSTLMLSDAVENTKTDSFTKKTTFSSQVYKTTTEQPRMYINVFPNETWRGLPNMMPQSVRCYLETNRKPRFHRLKWKVVCGSNYVYLERKKEDSDEINSLEKIAYPRIWRDARLDTSFEKIVIKLKCSDDYVENTVKFELWPQMKLSCNSSSVCKKDFDGRSRCVNNFCKCPIDSKYNGRICVDKPRKGTKSDIYKVILVAVACFAVTIIALFTLFLCNRSLFRRRHEHPLDDHCHDENNDVFSVSDELARLRLADKPPTYQEVIQNDRQFRGVPPPSYAVIEEPSPPGPGRSEDPVFEPPSYSSNEHAAIMRLAEQLTRTRIVHDEPNINTPIEIITNVNEQVRPEEPLDGQNSVGSYDNAGFVTDV